jgi:hypothetical protein
MKSEGLSVSVVIVTSKAIGERADRQLAQPRVRIISRVILSEAKRSQRIPRL